jgi:hypothetical protein
MSDKLIPKDNGLQKKSMLSNLAALTSSFSYLDSYVDPRQFNQLVLFLLDGSGSMTFPGETGASKGEETSLEVSKVLTRLSTSENKQCFDVGVYAFANEHRCILETTAVTSTNLSGDFNPCNYIKDWQSTRLSSSLALARAEAIEYVKEHDKPGKPAKAMIIILSDGVIHDFDAASRETSQAKLDARVFVSSVFFSSAECSPEASGEAQEMLRSLSSGGGLFSITDTVSDIREHMIHSIRSTMSL